MMSALYYLSDPILLINSTSLNKQYTKQQTYNNKVMPISIVTIKTIAI